MAPFKSSLARSAGKLFGVFKEADLSLRGATQSNRVLPVVASGGNIDGQPGGNGYTYHVFTGPGNFTVTQGGTVEILLVGGGGPSGSTTSSTTVGNCGGGGAGGVVHAPRYTIEAGTHPITVGDPAPQPLTPTPTRGVDSTFVGPTTITAQGGGVASYYTTNDGVGHDGGSGGGGGYPAKPGGTGVQPTLNPGVSGLLQYGNPGGQMAAPEGSESYDYGGGGGAGAAGTPGNGPATPAPDSGAGGDGQPFSAFPSALPAFSPLPSAWKTAVAPQGYFGGGGGGGTYDGLNPAGSMPGGLGGGGNGGTTPQNGITNTGGGAGGSLSNPGSTQPTGKKGGSGICIIRYSE
jgi:hypothetical protein